MKGLIVEILRPASGSDCTAGGVSSRAKEALLIDPRGQMTGPFEPDPKRPTLMLRFRHGHVHAIPADIPECEGGKYSGWMFGGNFVFTSDSRFREAGSGRYPIPIHDRRES